MELRPRIIHDKDQLAKEPSCGGPNTRVCPAKGQGTIRAKAKALALCHSKGTILDFEEVKVVYQD